MTVAFLIAGNSDEISDCDSYVSVLSEPKLVDWPNNMEVQVKQIACGTLNTMALSGQALSYATFFKLFFT